MRDQYVDYTTAKLALEKGFKYELSAFYYDGRLGEDPILKTGTGTEVISAPTQSLLQKWLRDEHKIYVSVQRCVIGSDEWEFGYYLDWLPKEHFEEKRRAGFFKDRASFVDNYPYHYSGAWHTYEEALENGLVEALKLV